MRHGYRHVLLIFLILYVFCFSGCGHEVPQVKRSAVLMDTVVTLQVRGEQAEAAVDAGMRRLEELDRMMGSESMEGAAQKLHAAAGKEYVKLQPEIYHVLEVSQRYSELTHGAWDITMGEAISLWGIGTEYARVPGVEEFERVDELCGWQHLKLRPEDKSAMLEREGMSIHLGGIGKGYALDEVRRIFIQYGIKDALIDMGASSICAMGKNDRGEDWTIGIRHPRKENAFLARVRLSDAMLSTSGDYERFFEADGKRYHHILDPKTLRPAESGIMSVTVLVDDGIEDAGMLGDLLSTAIFVMGPEEGKAFIEKLPEAFSAEITAVDGRILTAHGFGKRMEGVSGDFRVIE